MSSPLPGFDTATQTAAELSPSLLRRVLAVFEFENCDELWEDGLGAVFGDLLMPKPNGAVQACIYRKPLDAGIKGARGGMRRDAEAIFLIGPWPAGVGGDTSVLTTNALVAGPRGLATRYGHPHAKPVDLLQNLIEKAHTVHRAESVSPCVIADPFAGSGSTLVAASLLGLPSIGVELDERYCEVAARRLSAAPFDFFGRTAAGSQEPTGETG